MVLTFNSRGRQLQTPARSSCCSTDSFRTRESTVTGPRTSRSGNSQQKYTIPHLNTEMGRMQTVVSRDAHANTATWTEPSMNGPGPQSEFTIMRSPVSPLEKPPTHRHGKGQGQHTLATQHATWQRNVPLGDSAFTARAGCRRTPRRERQSEAKHASPLESALGISHSQNRVLSAAHATMAQYFGPRMQNELGYYGS